MNYQSTIMCVDEIIDFVHDIENKKRELTKTSLTEVLELAQSFYNEKRKLDFPYHINVIDELRANENAHSRILAKILQYKLKHKNEDYYPFFQSFLENIGIDKQVSKPTITVEKHRIDILILDKNFVLIIENKVNDAADQYRQLERYYDEVNERYPHYENEQIFILYLTRRGIKKPSFDSLPKEYRDILASNYKEINYHDNILPWLEEKVLPECRLKEKILSSAVHQYIDYLQGILITRKSMKEMDEKLKEFLIEKLKIEELKSENFTVISKNFTVIDEKIKEMDNCKKYLESIKEDMRNDLRATFKKKLYEKLKNEWICVQDATSGEISIDHGHIHLPLFGFKWDKGPTLKSVASNNKLYLRVEFHKTKEDVIFFCGLFPLGESDDLRNKLITLFEEKNIKIEDRNAYKSIKIWIFLHLKEYDKYLIAHNLNDETQDALFIEKMDDIVDDFYEKIIMVSKAWREICKELNNEIKVG